MGARPYDAGDRAQGKEQTPMNGIWSKNVLGVMTLYLSRKLRSHDAFFERCGELFDLDGNADMRLPEIGCGPGALAGSLHRRYPRARITAIDRDSRFSSFAKANVPGVDYIEGDAEALPFGDGSFDAVISNTVQEHIGPGALWGEQLRVLRPGGICLRLSARKGLRCTAACLETSPEKRKFRESVNGCDDVPEK